MQRRIASVIAALILSFLVTSSWAQNFRTYVASTGVDTNPCTLQQPCRLLNAALPLTVAGGEVWILDSANFNSGTVTINQSVTILAVPGASASVVSVGGTSSVVIGADGLSVTLKNLRFTPNAVTTSLGSGFDAASHTGTFNIEGCTFSGLTNFAALVQTPSVLTVRDSTFEGNASGITVSGGAHLTVSGSRFADQTTPNSGFAIYVGNGGTRDTTVTVSDSVFANNWAGVYVNSGSTSAVARASVTRSVFTNNQYAVTSEGTSSTAELSIGRSQITYSGYAAMFQGGGILKSLGDNLLDSNATDTVGTITSLTPK